MKSESFDFKRIFVVFSFILVFVLIAAFVFVYFTPKNEESAESFSEASDPVSSASEIDVNSNTSSTARDIRRQNEDKILAGEISSYTIKNFIEWYCRNMLSEYGTLSEISAVPVTAHLFSTENFSVYLAVCQVSFTSGNETLHYYIHIIMGTQSDSAGYYYLIDGFLSEQPSMLYDLRKSWDQLKKHAVFGKYVGDFPQETRSDEIIELQLYRYIGEDRQIFDSLYVSEDIIAILSADFSLQSKVYYTNWKVDFINLNDPEQTVSHPLAIENKEQLLFYSHSKDKDYITLYFDSENNKTLEYKVKIGTSKNDEDIINILEPDEDLRYLYSESGRYFVFIDEENLYLHDTVANKDILVFEATKNKNIYTFASPAFFVGETLYYNIHLLEGNAIIGSYNPDTKAKKLYDIKMHAMFYCNGYIYGWSDETDGERSGYKRFSLKNPEKVEFLLEHNGYATILPSPDEKYIIKFDTLDDNHKVFESTVTIYDAKDFTEIKTFTLTSAYSYFNEGIISGGKLFIPIISNVFDNKAFLIDLNNLS